MSTLKYLINDLGEILAINNDTTTSRINKNNGGYFIAYIVQYTYVENSQIRTEEGMNLGIEETS